MAQSGYTPIQLYYSTTASAVPLAADLVPGELGLNIADMKLYCENSSGVVTLLASSSGASGDVVGPASATDNAIVRFDGTTGKLVQNSGVTIDDNGNMLISVNSATNGLRITQVGAGNALLVEDSANPDSTPFVIDSSGIAIQGTTAYDSNWFSSGNVPKVYQIANPASTNREGFASISYSGAPGFSMFRATGGVIGTEGAVANGDNTGIITFAGYDGTTAGAIPTAMIQSNVDGTPGVGDMPGRLVFSTTADGASSVTERMRIDNAGNVGIGATPSAGTTLRVGKGITGATVSIAVNNNGTIQSDVTSQARMYSSFAQTAAASFTLNNLYQYIATQGTFGLGSTVTNQYGYVAESTLTGATNNYGFYSDIAAPTSGITTTGTVTGISSSGTTVTVNHDAITYTNGQTVTVTATANATALVSGATCTILSVGTTDFTLIGAANNTVGTSFTATGAGTGTGTVTLNVQGSGKTVAGAASGSFSFTTSTSQTFTSVAVTGSVTVSTRWNVYASGTAPNYLAGNLRVATTTNTNNSAVVAAGVIESTTGGFRFPDGTTQTTAGGGTTSIGLVRAIAINCILC
jgi:hypothetical protein